MFSRFQIAQNYQVTCRISPDKSASVHGDDGASFEAGIPKPLFAVPTVLANGGGGAPFVVTSDSQRFLVLARSGRFVSQ
jgi:hypothetical protein